VLAFQPNVGSKLKFHELRERLCLPTNSREAGWSANKAAAAAILMIKGFAVDWGDSWRRTVWAQLEHFYWFNVSPDRQVEFDRSSSRVAPQ
jgi:hypothetical protein